MIYKRPRLPSKRITSTGSRSIAKSLSTWRRRLKRLVKSHCSASERKVRTSSRWKILQLGSGRMIPVPQLLNKKTQLTTPKAKWSTASLSKRWLTRCGKRWMSLTRRSTNGKAKRGKACAITATGWLPSSRRPKKSTSRTWRMIQTSKKKAMKILSREKRHFKRTSR